jgi:hypothetical protein
LLASFITVGDKFACAADLTNKLICWGETAPLMLPMDPLRVRDIAAGQGFVCAIDTSGAVQCFGQAPQLPAGKYSTINAGFGRVCAVRATSGGVCVGPKEQQFEGAIRRFAVGKASVCAHLLKNELSCKGASSAGQLKVPLDTTKAHAQSAARPNKISATLWLDFLEQFPQVKLPASFRRDSEVSLGDRLPARFEPLVSEDPNRFRTGVGFSLPFEALGVTLFDLERRQLSLYIFKDRALVDHFALIKWSPETVGPGDDSPTSIRKLVTRESVITADASIESVQYEGQETTSYVKKHQDGSRPISSINCQIQKSSWVSTLTPTAKTSRTGGQAKNHYGAIDQKGCAGHFPFME